ncbi:zinc finger protein 586-like [Melanaphis sacchari]|uniref:zinc finger protein 586-like n=1 Tax=Melanaphis sacchari TaxID=742174 RepID=UPI000DC153ED|nr:zinc finger protein 586-like [Melanaphis sacchari]
MLLHFCSISGRYMCPNTCGRSYKERHNLIRHLRKECGVAPQHKCIQCSKAFKHKAHLTRHLLSCSNIPPSFECIFCGRMFRCLLSRWPCMNNCGRSYKNKGDLIRHIRKECGIPPQYSCDTCRKMFKHVHHLKSHMIVVHQKLFKSN